MSSLKQAIETLDSHVPAPQMGLGDEVFRMVSRLTPMVNVDLLIKNENHEVLLTWRDDELFGPGWHVPGGVLRYKETFEARIHAVAHLELNAKVKAEKAPCRITPIICSTRETRGHFISLLFNCELLSPLDVSRKFTPDNPIKDQWGWHRVLPENLIEVHKEIYSDIFSSEAACASSG